MKWYQLSAGQVCQLLDSSTGGLESGEAAIRLRHQGPNQLDTTVAISPWKILLQQFRSFIIYLLLVAVVFSFVIGEWVDATAILAILLLNAGIGFFQEWNARKSLEALRSLEVPSARVFRDRSLIRIPAKELVTGDVILLEAGDRIPADLRLLEVSRLKLDESALTGESLPVTKHRDPIKGDATLGDQLNLAFSSTKVLEGAGKGIVIRTGADTEIGRITELVREAETRLTPLQQRLERFGYRLGAIVLLVCLIIGVTLSAQAYLADGLSAETILHILLVAVALAVAAVPEGLPAVVTLALSIGVKRLLKRNALIRRLASVETLGSCDVICSDKTGTLTQNQMVVTHAWTADGREATLDGRGYSPDGQLSRDMPAELFAAGFTCNHASLNRQDGEWTITGDPTEAALLVSACKAGVSTPREILEEWPFDSDRKRMSVVVAEESRGKVQYTKGAPGELLAVCSHILVGNDIQELTSALRESVRQQVSQYSRQALRVLAFASKPLEATENLDESGLTFLGLQAMMDPPREGVQESVDKAHEAGIRVIMITGDFQETAVAIGEQIGIRGAALTGLHLDELDDEGLDKALAEGVNFFTRVAPAHKQRIIASLQRSGHVVAMTGDGVNDAPALKQADIGIAVGSGTDVAREASDLVLLDDAFPTIVAAIEEGRGIYTNIQKAILLLLSGNLMEVLMVFGAVALGMPLPLAAVMLLWINLISDGAPALAMSTDPYPADLMKQAPVSSSSGLLPLRTAWLMVVMAVLGAGMGLWLFHQMLPEGETVARTQTFNYLVIIELVLAMLIRFDYRVPLWSNIWIWLAVTLSLGLQVLILITPAKYLFEVVEPTLLEWDLLMILILCWAATGITLTWIRRMMLKSRKNR